MRITAILEETFPLRSQIRNAVIDFSEMTASAVVVVSDVRHNGSLLKGYGFNSNGRYAQGAILKERLIPRLLGAPPESLLSEDGANFDPSKAWQIAMRNEKPGGHGERSVALGALDMALWDLVAKIEEKPLCRLLAERFNRGLVDEAVWVYAAGGYYYPGKDRAALQEEVRHYLQLGYRDVKIKIGGASLEEDLRRIEAVLEILGPGNKLAVDANARFDLPTALQYAEALGSYDLKWYEEPGDPLDYELLSRVAEAARLPLATGENLFSHQDARNLVRYGGMKPERDFLQFDPALSYGLVEYLRILEVLEDDGWSRRRCVPHGGHQFALHLAAGLGLGGNESYPSVFQPFGGFADDVPVEDGYVRIPDAPGIGIERKEALYAVFQQVER